MSNDQTTAPANLRRPQTIPSGVWIAWFVLALITILNVNGISSMGGARQQLFSPVLLFCALTAITRLSPELKKFKVSPMPWIFVFCVVFMIVALFSATTAHYASIGAAVRGVPPYVAALLIVIAAVTVATRAVSTGQVNTLLKVLFWLVVVASLSGILLKVFPGPLGFLAADPGERRITGVFGNPNELGLQSGYAIVLGLGLTMRTRNPLWLILGTTAGIVGALSSFSKTALLGMLPLLALVAYALGGARLRFRPIALLVVGLFILVVGGQKLAFNALENATGLQLDNEQRRRLVALSDLLESRELNSTSTTGRTVIWKAGLQDWARSPVIGLGLTAFTRVRSVDMEIHNTFLRVLGEAGIVGFIPFMIMLMAFGRAVIRVDDPSIHVVGLGFILVQFPLMMSTGGVLLLRNHNMLTGSVLGLVVGYLVLEKRMRTNRLRLIQPAAPVTAPSMPVENS